MKQLFIIEGSEYTGKSSLLMSLAKTYENSITTNEPGGTPFGMDIRSLLKGTEGLNNLTYLFGMFASRVENVERVIVPYLYKGNIVLTDRFDLSTYAYQVLYNDINLKDLFLMCREHTFGAMFKEQGIECNYILLDVDPKVAAERKAIAIGDRSFLDGEGDQIEAKYSNLNALRNAYRTALDDFTDMGFTTQETTCVVDTSDLTQEQVLERVVEFINKRVA